MADEFARGRDITKRIEEGRAEWSELFELADHLSAYTHYLQAAPRAPGARPGRPTATHYLQAPPHPLPPSLPPSSV